MLSTLLTFFLLLFFSLFCLFVGGKCRMFAAALEIYRKHKQRQSCLLLHRARRLHENLAADARCVMSFNRPARITSPAQAFSNDNQVGLGRKHLASLVGLRVTVQELSNDALDNAYVRPGSPEADVARPHDARLPYLRPHGNRRFFFARA